MAQAPDCHSSLLSSFHPIFLLDLSVHLPFLISFCIKKNKNYHTVSEKASYVVSLILLYLYEAYPDFIKLLNLVRSWKKFAENYQISLKINFILYKLCLSKTVKNHFCSTIYQFVVSGKSFNL